MSIWRPSPDEERWLEVAARLRGALAMDLTTDRTGGWRSAGLFARIALFVLGLVAAALMLAVLGFNHEAMLLVAGVVAAGASEWLKVGKRLQASGIEEGLCVGGYLLIGLWIAGKAGPVFAHPGLDIFWLVVIGATGAAGLRLLNPLLTTCAALAFVEWLDATQFARGIDTTAGGGMTALVFACAVAGGALAAGTHEFRRPSHDRMLDWVVVALPVFAYLRRTAFDVFDAASFATLAGTNRAVVMVLLLALGIVALATGLRRRRHAPLLAFLGCLGCVAVELRFSSSWPTEAWLVIYGLTVTAAGLAIDRYLRQPRNGLTSEKLADREGALDLLQTAGAAVLTQSGGPGAQPVEPAPVQHEGRFGGGGASGSF